MDKIRKCPFCHLKLNKEFISKNILYICRNEHCRFRVLTTENKDSECRIYVETLNGTRIYYTTISPKRILKNICDIKDIVV